MGRRARGSEGAPPAAPVAPLTHPVRLSALAALDIQQASEWHDARKPGLGDQFLQRVNETMTRIGQNPRQYPTIIEDVRRVACLLGSKKVIGQVSHLAIGSSG